MTGKEQVIHDYLQKMITIMKEDTADKADLLNLREATKKFEALLTNNIDAMPGAAPGQTFFRPAEKIIPERDTFNPEPPPSVPMLLKKHPFHCYLEELQQEYEGLHKHLEEVEKLAQNPASYVEVYIEHMTSRLSLSEDFLPEEVFDPAVYINKVTERLNEIITEYNKHCKPK